MEKKILKFADSELTENIKKALDEFGYIDATPIQAEAIPNILEGKDIIGQSQTGTGKTAAYGLPIINTMDKDSRKVQALILCPTRELALQVVGEFRKFAKYENGIKALAVYGGESIERQILSLKGGVQIIVGTPGRIMDHMRRKTLRFNDVKTVVLDEADEMLNMGFEEDINTILGETPSERQTVLFSATMNERILGIAKKYLNNPYKIKVKSKELTVDKIEQIAIELKQPMKDETLTRLIDINKPKKAVVFCNTKRKVDDLIENLKRKGYKAECLHGDIRQEQRERIMKRFKGGEFQLLVATDVVARGIDVDELELVINYDVPQEEEYYIHRIGRTGRNGNIGKAYTFVVGKEKLKLASIEKYAHTNITPGKIPTDAEIKDIKSQKIIGKIQTVINEKEFEKNKMINELYEKLIENADSENVIKALLQLAVGEETVVNTINVPKEKSKRSDKSAKDLNNVRFFVSVGRMDSIKPKDIVGSVTSNTAISGNEIGKIDILDKFSFIEVPNSYANELLNGMNGKTIKGREVSIELARNK